MFSTLTGYIDETSGFGKSAVIVFPIMVLGAIYALSQVKARLQGDAEDRKKLNIAKDEQKREWKEQERISQLKRESEEMAYVLCAATGPHKHASATLARSSPSFDE